MEHGWGSGEGRVELKLKVSWGFCFLLMEKINAAMGLDYTGISRQIKENALFSTKDPGNKWNLNKKNSFSSQKWERNKAW